MKSLIIAMIISVILVTAAHSADEINGIAVVVNDEIVTLRELSLEYDTVSREIEEKEGPLTVEAADILRTKVLDSLVDRLLVKQKIAELNIVVSEEEVRQSIEEVKKQNDLSQEGLVAALITQGMAFDQYKEQMRSKLERLRLMGQEVNSKVQINDEEVRAYYAANQQSFKGTDKYRARAIFLRLSEGATSEEIRTTMLKFEAASAELRKNRDFDVVSKKLSEVSTPEEIRTAMLKFEAASAAARKNNNFAELAKKYSDDEIAKKDGGDLGFFKKGEMLPEIEKIVLSMKTGEVDTITAPGGFYMIKLEEKIPGIIKPFDEVKESIEEILYQNKSDERFAKWIKELRSTAAIEINQ